jgi:hypothetical protein
MGVIGPTKMSVLNYHYSLRNSPEERSSHLLRGGSLKFNRTFQQTSTFSVRLNKKLYMTCKYATKEIVFCTLGTVINFAEVCSSWRNLKLGVNLVSKTPFTQSKQSVTWHKEWTVNTSVFSNLSHCHTRDGYLNFSALLNYEIKVILWKIKLSLCSISLKCSKFPSGLNT